MLKIRLAEAADLPLYQQHELRLFKESGRDGDFIFTPVEFTEIRPQVFGSSGACRISSGSMDKKSKIFICAYIYERETSTNAAPLVRRRTFLPLLIVHKIKNPS